MAYRIVLKGVLLIDEEVVQEWNRDEEEHGIEVHRPTHCTQTLGSGRGEERGQLQLAVSESIPPITFTSVLKWWLLLALE